MMTTMVETSGANVMSSCCVNCGMFESRMSMSLENRLTMRPSGVVSKKDIGQRMTPASRPPWRLRDATMLPREMDSARPNTDTATRQEG